METVNMTEEYTHRESFSEKTMTEGSANEHTNGNTNDSKDAIGEKQIDATKNDPPAEHEYPGALSLAAILVAVYLAIFLVALVSTLPFLEAHRTGA